MEDKEIMDAEENVVIALVHCIADWFADHPQASQDCRDYVNRCGLFDEELLDEIFVKEKTEFPELDLPKDTTIDPEELDVDNWGDDEEIENAIGNYLSNVYGFCVNSYDYELDTKDSGDVTEIIISDIDWDIDD